MTTKNSLIVIGLLIIVSAAIGFYFYPFFPAEVASHWGMDGEVNGYMPKFWAVTLMPLLMLGMTGLFIWLPKIDPLKENISAFRKEYNLLITAIIAFLFYINLLTLFWNAEYHFDMAAWIAPALGILWFFIGTVLPKTKRNWFMGIRTPWSLSSDRVWKETHEFGGKLFKLSGMIAILGLFFPKDALWLVLTPVIFSSVAVVVYSYISFKKK